MGRVWEFENPVLAETVYRKPQRGYWLYCRGPINAVVRGLRSGVGEMALQPGWNLVGPAQEMNVTDLDDSRVWSWDGRHFKPATILEAGKGYWIHSDSSRTIGR